MPRKKLPITVLALVFFILIVNYAAMKFHWYYSVPWFDMLMHFLGGLWLGLAFIWLYPAGTSYLKIIAGVLLVGVFWEIFELVIHQYFLRESFDLPDTLSDLFFDMLGGGVAVFYLINQKRDESRTKSRTQKEEKNYEID